MGLARSAARLNWIELPEFAPFPNPIRIARPATLNPRSASRRRTFARRGQEARVLRRAARRRHRLGQDRSLFRGRRARRCAQDAQVLILLPEIALTVQFLDRFAARFGCRPARMALGSLRSRTPPRLSRGRCAARRASWSARARRCSCRFQNSASSSSMKNTSRPTSRRRASSITRATWPWSARGSENCPIVLACATPSLETFVNAKAGSYDMAQARAPPRRGGDARRSGLSTCARTRREPGQFLSPHAARAR